MTSRAYRPGVKVRFADHRRREHEGIIYRCSAFDWFSLVDEHGTQWNTREKDAEVLDADTQATWRSASQPQKNVIRRLAPELVPATGKRS